MEGCLANLVKYTLFLTNLLIFVLGLVTLGFGIWVVVDKPSFLDLFTEAQDAINANTDINTDSFDLGIYAGAPILLIVVAVLVSIIAFFGCFGAMKESKCLLITYFIIVLSIFIAFIVGAVLVYQGGLDDQVKQPLIDSMQYYKDQPTEKVDISFKAIWNTVQEELRCCGVNNVTDWTLAINANWEGNAIKPEGCCEWTRDQDAKNSAAQILECRKHSPDAAGYDIYYYKGCYTLIVDEIEKHQSKIFGAAIGTAVVMFVSLLFSFAMCTMAD